MKQEPFNRSPVYYNPEPADVFKFKSAGGNRTLFIIVRNPENVKSQIRKTTQDGNSVWIFGIRIAKFCPAVDLKRTISVFRIKRVQPFLFPFLTTFVMALLQGLTARCSFSGQKNRPYPYLPVPIALFSCRSRRHNPSDCRLSPPLGDRE